MEYPPQATLYDDEGGLWSPYLRGDDKGIELVELKEVVVLRSIAVGDHRRGATAGKVEKQDA
jgi:hypothetical protein